MDYSSLVNSDISFGEGQDNFGGIRKVYYGFLSDVDETQWPEPAAAPTSFTEAITIATPIVMLTGKKMNELYVTPETSGLDGEGQGDRDAQSTKRSAELLFPKSNADSLGFAKATINRNMFFLLEDMSGLLRLIGSPKFPANCTAKDTTGKASTDRPGVTFTVEDIGIGPCPIYAADVPLEAAV